MNYLAHLHLANDDGAFLVGNLMGDFVRGQVARLALPEPMRAGIRLHRRIDTLTDRHPATVSARRRLRRHRRMAGVLVDIAFDHFLARHWSRYSSERLERFTARSYAVLTAHACWLPPRLNRMLPRMAAEDWLGRYRHPTTLKRVVAGLSRRASRPELLHGGAEEMLEHYDGLEADFHALFPDLEAAARQWRNSHGYH
jgi:acyl carrier protein phosphodiesterase